MKKILAVLLLPLLFAAPSIYAMEEHEAGGEYVEFAANIEFIKGHLLQAVANKQQDELELAKTHAGHPIAEVYTLISGKIAEDDAAMESSLKDALESLPDKVDSLSAADFAAAVSEAEQMLDDAMMIIPQDDRDDRNFWIHVMAQLLETAEHEYEEAVSDGQIEEMVEYQDAQGFVARADAIFMAIADKIDEHERGELEGFFTDLKGAMDAMQDPEDVETFIDAIINELREVAGLEMEVEMKPSIATIKLMLEKLLHEYEEGEYAEAEEIAVKAYLDNYEFLEAEIEEKDPELMENTEIMLREELRALIKERAPMEQVEAKVQEINVNLNKILELGIGTSAGDSDPRLAYVANIRMLLNEALEEYEEGEHEEAMSLVVKAYLDNYEYLELDVKAHDKELNEEIERMLKEELREKIESGAPASEVKALAAEISMKMDTVEVIVPEFPLGLAIAMASIMGMMVLFTRFKPRLIRA
jgi:hypothetical protein